MIVPGVNNFHMKNLQEERLFQGYAKNWISLKYMILSQFNHLPI